MSTTQRARIAALTRWSREDPRPATAKAPEGFRGRFLNEVDPDRTLPIAERERRAAAAMRAHMLRLAALSAKARSKGAEK